ncbi:MAG TPA: thermonuclease family protein [Paludibacter sp.]|jgi:endonuclease YncB( thermonuclease family)|nr:thermonuclease family protein [Paludibacter sp.]
MHSRLFLFRTIILLFVILFLACTSIPISKAAIRTVTGTITKVSDGDTAHLTTPEQTKLKVRLYGIDAPETDKINNKTGHVNIPGQPYGEESMNALANKIMDKKVKVDILDIDKYRRMVGMIYLDDRNINLEMIRDGYAEAFVEYLKPPYREEFLAAEREAQSTRKGIWSLPDYERPRAFRKRLKVRGAK